jgi:ribosomal protein S18 acetylase RimI-like enzyme
MNVSIERATAADAHDLVRVQIAAFHHDSVLYPGIEPGGPPGYDSVEHMLENIRLYDCYTIAADGRCIGGMVAFRKEPDHYHLDLIFIDPACHDRGIGTQAMQFIEAAHPAALWTLDTPQYAVRNQHFYEKLGYVNVREYLEGDFPLIAYEKRVAR